MSLLANILTPIRVLCRRAIDRDEFGYTPAERIDLPATESKAPEYIPSPSEAAALIAALPLEDRGLWATAFYRASPG